MLETGEVLRTWRLSAPPSTEAAAAAEPLGEHRKLYLDYEGPVSRGRGTVRRWDAGTYADLREHEGMTEFRLEGGKVRGRCRVERDADGWRLEFAEEGS
jgi:hypothetical protein